MHVHRLLLSLLVPLAVACRPVATSQPVETETETESKSTLDTSEVIDWFVGSPFRTPPPRSNLRSGPALVGIVTVDPKQEGSGVVRPNSCRKGLISFIPTPVRAGVWFGTDHEGRLLRYSDGGWSVVSVKPGLEVPQIDRLLALSGSPARFELLVAARDPKQEITTLSVLFIVHEQVVDVQPPEPALLTDRKSSLLRFDNGRCVQRTQNCLHLTTVGDEVVLTNEPELDSDRDHSPVGAYPREETRDIRYADVSGSKVDVLTGRACLPAADPPLPSPKTETSP